MPSPPSPSDDEERLLPKVLKPYRRAAIAEAAAVDPSMANHYMFGRAVPHMAKAGALAKLTKMTKAEMLDILHHDRRIRARETARKNAPPRDV